MRTSRYITVMAVVAGSAFSASPAMARSLKIEVRSSPRADLVTDGQAIFRIVLPARARGFKVTLNGRSVTRRFIRHDGDGADERTALLEKLKVGTNRVVARVRGHRAVQLIVTNHPNGGPVFGGPQVQPWRCQATARDKQCNQPANYHFLYKSTDPTKAGLTPYDGNHPPSDVAMTTTNQGVRVPMIVREEIGYIARDQYRILVLMDPSKRWDRWAPPRTWNHRLLVTGGGGCGADHSVGGAPLADFSGTIPPLPLRDDSYIDALKRGFAVMSTALANTGHNCNVATEAEALIMTKERVIERYGDVSHTIGTGCSGGSVVQHTVANAYPGAVYDGLIVTCAFPDTFTAGAQFADVDMLRRYFENPARWAPGTIWNPVQWASVEGQLTPVNGIVADEFLFKAALNPVGDCGPTPYDPVANPGGVRCDVLTHILNITGPRPAAAWSDAEKKIGHGFAGIPFGNAGIQYGLESLRERVITAEQFVDLNEKVGGLDINARPQAARLEGDDLAIARTYRSGLVDEGDNLDQVAIIDHSGPDPGIAHDFAHAWWTRDRIQKVHGTFANQVLWVGAVPLIGGTDWPTEAIDKMDSWLSAVDRDHSDRSLAKKIIVNRPADVRDRCQYTPFVHISALDNTCLPDVAHLRLGTAREIAGSDRLNDILKCQLKPLVRGDYSGAAALSDAQFARLQKVFPKGVCDWSKPGVGQQPVVPWLTYQDRKGRVIYGGKPMPRPPVSKTIR